MLTECIFVVLYQLLDSVNIFLLYATISATIMPHFNIDLVLLDISLYCGGSNPTTTSVASLLGPIVAFRYQDLIACSATLQPCPSSGRHGNRLGILAMGQDHQCYFGHLNVMSEGFVCSSEALTGMLNIDCCWLNTRAARQVPCSEGTGSSQQHSDF